MRFLVTGGAGFMGINLVRMLLDKGHFVRSYDIAPFAYPEADQVDVLRGDIRDMGLHDQAFDGIDVMVHCAAALPLCDQAEIMSTNVDGTRMLLETARAKGTARFIHISTTAVYGIPDHHPLIEEDPMIGVGPYGASKVRAEEVCQEFRAGGMCLPVLRPKSFVGPERLGAFELLYDFACDGHGFPVLGSGNNRYQLLDVEDLNDAVLLCATLAEADVNDTFNVGAAEFGTLRESFQAVLDRAGHGRRVVGFPAGPAIAVLRMLEALGLSPLYKWIYETAGKGQLCQHRQTAIAAGLGGPRHSNAEALVRNYEWYLANRDRITDTNGCVTPGAVEARGTASVAVGDLERFSCFPAHDAVRGRSNAHRHRQGQTCHSRLPQRRTHGPPAVH